MGEPPTAYGRYENIFLSKDEYDELQAEYPDRLERLIEEMSHYLAASGKAYQNYAAALHRWAANDKKGSRKTGHPRLYLYGGRKLMTSEIKDILENMTTAAPEMEDYIGEDGLLFTAESAIRRKKPTSRRVRSCLAVTATRQSATAREPPVSSGRPPRNTAAMWKPWKI